MKMSDLHSLDFSITPRTSSVSRPPLLTSASNPFSASTIYNLARNCVCLVCNVKFVFHQKSEAFSFRDRDGWKNRAIVGGKNLIKSVEFSNRFFMSHDSGYFLSFAVSCALCNAGGLFNSPGFLNAFENVAVESFLWIFAEEKKLTIYDSLAAFALSAQQ